MQIKKHFNPVPHEHVLQWACGTRLNARNKFLCNQLYNKKKSCNLTKMVRISSIIWQEEILQLDNNWREDNVSKKGKIEKIRE